jgi:4-alpha-glucanotransferase
MRDAGAIRLDHVMGLLRQFWIPRGCGADRGGYVAYPFESLLRRLADASQRHRCAVIGEDLGNVPAGFRERMEEARILGYRVVYFQRDADGKFLPPSRNAALTAAAVSTHDLPTIAGFRAGSDIDAREAKGLFASPMQAAAAREERRASLVALESALADYANTPVVPGAFADALHRFLAASGSRLVIVQIEDVLGVRDQANLPGLGDEEPNWRRRLPVTLEAFASDIRVQTLAEIFAGRATRQGSSRSTTD